MSFEHAVACDDVDTVRILLGFGQWMLCLGERDVIQVCLFMYSYSSSFGSSNRPDEWDLPILPEMALDVERRVSEVEKKNR